MNIHGQFGLAFSASLAVHALALAVMAYLGAFKQKPAAFLSVPPQEITLTLLRVVDDALPLEPSRQTPPSAPLTQELDPATTDAHTASAIPPSKPPPRSGPTPVESDSIVLAVPLEATTFPARVERAGEEQATVSLSTSSPTNACFEGTLPDVSRTSDNPGHGDGNGNDGTINGPAYRRNPPPRYPAAARRRGEEGLVLLKVLVDERGHPARVNVAASSDSEALDSAASGAVRHWEFEPALRAGRPVAREVQVPIRFTLERQTLR